MSRGRHIVILVLVLCWFAAPAVSANESGTYVTNVYQDDPSQWSDPWRDSTLGPRNNVSAVAGHVGTGVRVAIDAGSHFGTAMRWRFADNGLEEPDALWFRYYLRFPEGFANVGKGKLPGPAGIYSQSARGDIPSTPAQPGWSARMLFSPSYDETDADHTRIGYYLYHLDQAADHGDLLLWDQEVASLAHGDWYCVEGYVQMNTPGEADGALAGWVDGTAAFSREDVRFRRSNESEIHVDSFWFDVYYGGRDVSPVGLAIDFDSLAFGQERIGCDDWSDRGFAGGFFDDEGSVHEGDIEFLLAAGVVNGCNANGDAFCPDDPVTRGQMAKILVRGLGLPPSDQDFFTDDDGSVYEASINSLAAAGITNGCGANRYCPGAVMSRAQVAAFINRALGLPATTDAEFADVADSPFRDDVNALAAAGLTSGCHEDSFCPNAVASRSETASFVARAMDYQEQQDREEELRRERALRVVVLGPWPE